MAADFPHDQREISKSIKTSLKKTQDFVSGRQRTNSRLLFASMALSGASTLVAGVTSAAGPVIGSGIEGWRLACIAAAVFGFTATISTGTIQHLESTDRLSKGKECLRALRSLDLGMTTGRKKWEEVIEEYEDLAQNYPELIS